MQVGIYPAQGSKKRFCHDDADDEDSPNRKPKPKSPFLSSSTDDVTGRTDSTATTRLLPLSCSAAVHKPQPQCTQNECGRGCSSWPPLALNPMSDDDDQNRLLSFSSSSNSFSSVALPWLSLTSSKSYSGLPSACSACPSGTTRRLLALLRGDGIGPPDDVPLLGTIRVGLMSSRHLRKQLLKSLGIPSSTTVETGTNGRSSMPAARIAYSWAKSSALWKDGYSFWASPPTMMYISKKASST